MHISTVLSTVVHGVFFRITWCGYRESKLTVSVPYLAFVFAVGSTKGSNRLRFRPKALPALSTRPTLTSFDFGAGTGNRTRIPSLARTCSTTKPYPQTLTNNARPTANNREQDSRNRCLRKIEMFPSSFYAPTRIRSLQLQYPDWPFSRKSLKKCSIGLRILDGSTPCFLSHFAPTRIRTWNICFEGRYDIHFTIGASV